MTPRGKPKALPANCVEEEYFYLSLQKCPCGGALEADRQALVVEEGAPFDRITALCAKCGAKSEFNFDIGAFYGDLSKYGKIVQRSQIIDALEWLTLAVLFIREAESQGDEARKMLLGEADFCLDQLSMFYPEGAQYPAVDSFFNQPEGALPPKRRDLFHRSRVEMLKKEAAAGRAPEKKIEPDKNKD